MSDDLVVPFLRKGAGKTPQDGGCIMQVVDWIHRKAWTDSPPCVDPAIQGIAISLNDFTEDEERQRLLDLAPRLMHTTGLSLAEKRKIAISIVKRLVSRLDTRSLGVLYSDRRSEFRDRALGIIEAIEAAADSDAYFEVMDRGKLLREQGALYQRGGVDHHLIEAVVHLSHVGHPSVGYGAEITSTALQAIATGDGIDEQMEIFGWILDEFHARLETEKIEELDFGPVCEIMAGTPA